MKKHLQRLFAVIFAALFAVAAFPLGAVAAGPSVIVMEHSLDETDVMFDLENMEMQEASGQKEKINLGDFPLDTTLNETTEYVEVISLYEKGYTSENGIDSPSYGLYLYLYNPSGKKFSAFGNQANMATAFDGETGGDIYNLIDLQLLSQSEDGRFVKFKVRKTNGYFPCVFTERDGVDYRSYTIGSLTLSDGENRKSYKVGMSATYSGLEADNTLAFSGKEIDVLEIEVHHTSYLLDSSPLGEGHRSALNSCYFAIPESIIQRSGQLTNVKAEWYEYKTNPIPIFAKKADYDYYSQFVAKNLAKEEDFFLGVGDGVVNGMTLLYLKYDYMYGSLDLPSTVKLDVPEKGIRNYLPTVFYNPKASQYGNDLLIKGEDLLTDLRLNSSQLVRGLKTQIAALEKKENLGVYETLELEFARSQLFGKTGNYYSGFFQEDVDEGRKKGYNIIDAEASTPIDLKSFEGDWWAKLMEYGISYPDVNNSVTYPTIESIRDIVHDTSHSLGVNQRDLEELKNYSEKMEAFGYRPYIFRFAVTDVEMDELQSRYYNLVTGTDSPIAGFAFTQTVFLDFQVIEMTFTKKHEQTTIDTRYTVVSDPEDVTPDVEQRPEEDNNLISDAGIGALGLLNWLGDFLFGNDAFSIIKKVIGIIVIILLVRFVLIPVIRWLFSKIKKKDKPEKTIAVNETKKDIEKKE